MSIIIRKIASSPKNNASKTWDIITEIVCHKSLDHRKEFLKVKGGVCSVISEKTPKDRPIIIRGNGPLLRIYCLYGDDAVDSEEVSEDVLNWNPLSKNWIVYVPCPKSEIDGLQSFFKNQCENFLVYDSEDSISFQGDESVYQNSGIQIDENLLRGL